MVDFGFATNSETYLIGNGGTTVHSQLFEPFRKENFSNTPLLGETVTEPGSDRLERKKSKRKYFTVSAGTELP